MGAVVWLGIVPNAGLGGNASGRALTGTLLSNGRAALPLRWPIGGLAVAARRRPIVSQLRLRLNWIGKMSEVLGRSLQYWALELEWWRRGEPWKKGRVMEFVVVGFREANVDSKCKIG
jgi:hypothetical protein